MSEAPCDPSSHIYGGVRFGTCLIRKIWSVDVGEQPDTGTKVGVGILMLPFMAFFAVDLPFSFAADTVLLPVTIPVQAKLGDRCP